MGLQQGSNNGRLCHEIVQTREQVLGFENSSCHSRQQHGGLTYSQSWNLLEPKSLWVCSSKIGATPPVHQAARAGNHWSRSIWTRSGGYDAQGWLVGRYHRLYHELQATSSQREACSKLYKRGSASRVLMKCITTQEGKELLQEIHERACHNHAVSRTLVGKALRFGFYWPTGLANTEELVRQCIKCHFLWK